MKSIHFCSTIILNHWNHFHTRGQGSQFFESCFWWFFPSMSLYEWDHRRQDPYKKIPMSHSLHPFTHFFVESFLSKLRSFFPEKKVAHKHSWLFRSFFNLQWVNIRLLSLLRIRDLREWHDNFTTKKGLFCYLTNRFFYPKKGLHCKLFKKSEKRW